MEQLCDFDCDFTQMVYDPISIQDICDFFSDRDWIVYDQREQADYLDEVNQRDLFGYGIYKRWLLNRRDKWVGMVALLEENRNFISASLFTNDSNIALEMKLRFQSPD